MKKNLLALMMLLMSFTVFSETITVTKALEIGSALAAGESTPESYTIEGYVNVIKENNFNNSYNNMSFWLADNKGSLSSNSEGALYVFRGRPAEELLKGDKISITSPIKNYNGTIETATANAAVTLLERTEAVTKRDTTYGSLRVCAQNLENYYINPNTGRGNYTEAEITAKTQKIAAMMAMVDADIYAFCEVEAKPEVLSHLAAAANTLVSGNPYVAVTDGIDEEWDATYNNNLKSGFIYRSDRVQPVGTNSAANTARYYCNTMRYQAFRQLSNNETLVLSMNHFKAKDSSTDQGEATRLANATSLVNALSYVSTDPDILILGDLNCTYDESPVTYIVNAGYAEQLLKYNEEDVYTHCYNGGELIDHVLANTTMANQIVDAYVRHISTYCSVGVTDEMRYSDHDPYVVEINLASSSSSVMTCAEAAAAAMTVSTNNEPYNNGEEYTVRGYVTRIQTAYNSQYGNITFWMADTKNGGNVLEAYKCAVSADAVPTVGDYVEVKGKLTKYNTIPEFAAGCTCSILTSSAPAVNLGAKTIAEFIALANIKDTCILTGVVSNIVNTTYGNFDLTDATGTLYIYGLLTAKGAAQQFGSMNIAAGDTLTIKACYAEYNGSPQAANAVYVSHSKFVPKEPSGPVTVKLDPESTTQYGWNRVGLWVWVTNESGTINLFESWPGIEVNKDAETGWWSYTLENLPEGELHIIWNDFGAGNQTNDIDGVTGNTCYRLTGASRSHTVVECPSESVDKPYLTVAEAIVLGNQLETNVASKDTVSVVGYVISANSYDQMFGNQTFLLADAMTAAENIKAYRAVPMKNGMPYPVLAGDKVIITGPVEHYVNNTTGEDFVELLQPAVTFLQEVSGNRSLPAIEEITVTEALKLGNNLSIGYRTNATYDITGYVSSIEEDAMESYGNMTFWLSDAPDAAASNADGAFYAFRAIPDRRLQQGDQVRIRTYVRRTAKGDSASVIQAANYANVTYLGHAATDTPTEADLIAAGYDTDKNVVMAFKFGVAPCYDVVIAGNYATDSIGGWITNPAQLVHMKALEGFDGWYAAELPYAEGLQAKPVQLNDRGLFSWDNQAGNSWTHKGGNEVILYSGFAGEVDVYYNSAGAYIYEIEYWKNGNNACEQITGTYTVLFKAPKDAPEAIEIIGSFDNWTGTAMSYNAQNGYWTATITATPSDNFKFRQAGTWGTEIEVYDTEKGKWLTSGNLTLDDYIINSSVVYVDFSDASKYRWTLPDLSYLYIPYNLKAVSEPGKVVFTWDAEVPSDTCYIKIYNASNDTYMGYLTALGGTSFTYMVEDFLDGYEVYWSLQPVSPYALNEVRAESSFTFRKSEVELSNFALSTTDSITIDLTWESNKEGLLYLVGIYNYSGYVIRYDTVNTTEYHFRSTIPGVVYVYVTPLNTQGETIGRAAYAGSINLARVPAPFYNLQGSAEEHTLSLTWEGPADSVYVQIYRMENGDFTELVYEGVVSGHSMSYTVSEDGTYALQLRAWSELSPGNYDIAPYANYVIVQAFTVPTYSVQINAGEGGYLWPTGLSGNYPEGYVLNVYVYAYDGYVFTGWNDGVQDNPRTITVSGNMSITALFEQEHIGTGFDNVSESQTAKKILKNGNVYIIRGGKTYTLQGQVVN